MGKRRPVTIDAKSGSVIEQSDAEIERNRRAIKISHANMTRSRRPRNALAEMNAQARQLEKLGSYVASEDFLLGGIAAIVAHNFFKGLPR